MRSILRFAWTTFMVAGYGWVLVLMLSPAVLQGRQIGPIPLDSSRTLEVRSSDTVVISAWSETYFVALISPGWNTLAGKPATPPAKWDHPSYFEGQLSVPAGNSNIKMHEGEVSLSFSGNQPLTVITRPSWVLVVSGVTLVGLVDLFFWWIGQGAIMEGATRTKKDKRHD